MISNKPFIMPHASQLEHVNKMSLQYRHDWWLPKWDNFLMEFTGLMLSPGQASIQSNRIQWTLNNSRCWIYCYLIRRANGAFHWLIPLFVFHLSHQRGRNLECQPTTSYLYSSYNYELGFPLVIPLWIDSSIITSGNSECLPTASYLHVIVNAIP